MGTHTAQYSQTTPISLVGITSSPKKPAMDTVAMIVTLVGMAFLPSRWQAIIMTMKTSMSAPDPV